uniref:Uncharacterized protein n=1 Tax=Arundo donax TaxID=35708 RepID=A0A0A9H1C8_ARUDO
MISLNQSKKIISSYMYCNSWLLLIRCISTLVSN